MSTDTRKWFKEAGYGMMIHWGCIHFWPESGKTRNVEITLNGFRQDAEFR